MKRKIKIVSVPKYEAGGKFPDACPEGYEKNASGDCVPKISIKPNIDIEVEEEF